MFESKWNNVSTSIFSVMSEKANQAKALNLAQGFPDFDGPQIVKDAAKQAIDQGYNQYAPAAGLLSLRELVAARKEATSGLTFDPGQEITIFSGATEAIFCAINAFFGPGDELIAFAPYYDSYPLCAMTAGCTFKQVELEAPDWNFSDASLEKAISSRTKGIILNTPHNPTGKVFSVNELERIARLAIKNDLLVITDEVYEDLVFDGAKHISIATLPGMKDRTITISSTSKTYSFTGWKVGYAMAPRNFTSALRNLHQAVVFCSATPLQHGIAQAFKLDNGYYDEFRQDYQTKRDLLFKALTDVGFRANLPQGTYFILADYSAFSTKADFDFAVELIDKIGLAAIPISSFYLNPVETQKKLHYLRFAFCKNEATLKQAHELLLKLAK
jgi:N-succinyldiaminopimelate aminotransferase